MDRHAALVVALLVLLAGCSGGPTPSDAGTGPTTDAPTTGAPTGPTSTDRPQADATPTATRTVAGTATPVPHPAVPDDPNATAAERFALAHERVRLHDRLAGQYPADRFGLGCCTARTYAATVASVPSVRFVRVQYAYWYGTDEVEADAASQALYAVGPGRNVTRIPLGERAVEPRLSAGTGDGAEAGEPPQVRVVNAMAGERRPALILVNNETGETVLNRKLWVDGGSSVGVRLDDLPAGEYRLTASTLDAGADADATGTFAVPSSGRTELFVLLTPRGGPLVQEATLDPRNVTRPDG